MRDLIDRRSDDSEVEALLGADIAIEHHAKMQFEIHLGCRQPLRPAAFVDGFDRRAGTLNGVECAAYARARSSAGKTASTPSPISFKTSPECSWMAETIASA